MAILERSSSYYGDRTNNSNPISDQEEANTTLTKCLSKSLKASVGTQLESESMRPLIFEGPTILSEGGTSQVLYHLVLAMVVAKE
ncbi:hypothetical protein L6452_18959 [Arctium lappa]|uniref:Uncharacterized protein n=1 Tax=Arctium lappa TaxID=4217 RepID=A0ACB9B7U0_ARCLA|nr:hypothetical protein L6452_18959 [Arctium lappa]